MNAESLQIDSARTDIVICSACTGHGKVISNLHHLSLEDETSEACSRCEGTGRMVKTTVVEYKKLSQ